MNLIDEFKAKVQVYEGYADAWIVSKKTAIITHGSVFAAGLVIGIMVAKHFHL